MENFLAWLIQGSLGPAIVALPVNFVRLQVKIARRPVLLFFVTLIFILSATLSLTLSGFVFQGWWQAFSLELGVGLLIAGIVDVAVLGALHELIEGGTKQQPKKADSVASNMD